MNTLEKIFRDIEEAAFQEDAPIYLGSMEVDRYVKEEVVKEIIRSHMDDAPDTNVGKWIPTSERLPNEEDFVKAYCRNHYCAEFIVMIEGASRPTTLYYKNGIWADEINNHYRVVAWKPLPEPYKPEEDKP